MNALEMFMKQLEVVSYDDYFIDQDEDETPNEAFFDALKKVNTWN